MKSVSVLMVAVMVIASNSHWLAGGTTTAPSKKWTTDLPGFLNTVPGDWIIGRSTAAALSAQEAQTMARDDAASALIARLRPQLDRRVHDRALARHVQAALAGDDLIVDRQVIATERPYGTIWSAAVLVDASGVRVEPLLREIQRSAMRERFNVVAGMTGAAMLTAVVAFSYLVLNWLTRGFFRGRLALASALIVAVGVIGIAGML